MKLNHGDLKISSPAFGHHERIPDRFAADGENVSPELRFESVPEGTRSLALCVHDPDAPLVRGFCHWVVTGIPADAGGIPEGGGDAFTQGPNTAGEAAWMGPAPPEGHGTHHYFFELYALDVELDEPLDREALMERIDGHVVEQARLLGTYKR